MDEDISEE